MMGAELMRQMNSLRLGKNWRSSVLEPKCQRCPWLNQKRSHGRWERSSEESVVDLQGPERLKNSVDAITLTWKEATEQDPNKIQ